MIIVQCTIPFFLAHLLCINVSIFVSSTSFSLHDKSLVNDISLTIYPPLLRRRRDSSDEDENMEKSTSNISEEITFPDTGQTSTKSSVVPRKGVENPPPLNTTSILPSNLTTTNVLENKKNLSSIISTNFHEDPFNNVNKTDNLNDTPNEINKDSTISKNTQNHVSNSTKKYLHFTISTNRKTIYEDPATVDLVHPTMVTTNANKNTSVDLSSELHDKNSNLFHCKGVKPTTAIMDSESPRLSYPTVLCLSVLTVVTICSLVGFITYKRLQGFWYRRQYSRMDYLIDGLYEM